MPSLPCKERPLPRKKTFASFHPERERDGYPAFDKKTEKPKKLAPPQPRVTGRLPSARAATSEPT